MVGIPRGFERFQPWWRGWYQGYGFNPVADLPGLALYHDIKVQDSTFQGLPGMAYAINQNDGIGAVLDLKRYKERGANVVTQDGSAWTASGSSPNQWTISGDTASVDNTGGTASCFIRHVGNPLTTGRLYELTFTVLSSNGVGGVRATTSTDNSTGYVTGTGEHTFLMRATGAFPTQFQFQANVDWIGSIDLSTITVREVPGYHAMQDLAAGQPTLNIEGGIRSALFDGVDDRLVIPNSAGAFNFLHNGEGGEFHLCYKAATRRVEYLSGSSNINGVGVIFFTSTTGQTRIGICNGSGEYVALVSSPTPIIQPGQPTVLGFSFDEAGARLYKDGIEIAATPIATPPVNVDASYDFTLGTWAPNASTFIDGLVYSAGVIQGILTDYDRQRLVSYMLRRAGA